MGIKAFQTLQTITELPVVTPLLALAQHESEVPILVGGAVRDALMGRGISPDLDWVVPSGKAQVWAEALANTLEGKTLCLDADFGIYRVIANRGEWTLDLADQGGPSLLADLGRRDLTVNAMAYHPVTQTLIDPFEGQKDLEAQIIRMVSPQNLVEDPLRLLRVFRFAADLGFTTITPDTLAVVQAQGPQLLRAAVERIQYEWLRLLSAPQCAEVVCAMGRVGLLEVLFPEMTPMHEVPPNQYHHLGLFQHTLELLIQLEVHLPDFPEVFQARLSSAFNPVASHLAVVRLACLFHDLGKPSTMAYDAETGRYRFYGHEAVSAEMTAQIAERMKWGKALTDVVCFLVAAHLYPGDMLKPEVSSKAKSRFYRRAHPWLAELLALGVADRFSAKGPAISLADLAASKAGLISLWNQYESFEESQKPGQILLKGRDLIDVFGLSPGPALGQLLSKVQEAYLNGEVSTRDEALGWIKNLLASSPL